MSETTRIVVPDGTFSAYVARPAVAPAPAVVVIQEIFGVNADVRATCDVLATQGFLALSPDLFWRLRPGVDLTDQTEIEWQQAMALYKQFDIASGVADIAATLSAARTLAGSSGKVGVLGYCLGGLLTFLTAVRVGADVAVAYYGGGIDKYLGEARTLRAPLMLHFGEQDEFISEEAQRTIKAALRDDPRVQIHTYRGVRHAFARHGGKNYDAEAAEQANARTLEFLRSNLGAAPGQRAKP